MKFKSIKKRQRKGKESKTEAGNKEEGKINL